MPGKLTLIAAALLWCGVATAPAANIIVVTENVDKNLDRVADDQGLIDWLIAEGHSVDVRRNAWGALDSKLIAELNAADLILVSRLANSGGYDYGDAPTQWNSVKTPLLLMSAYFARNTHWKWVNSAAVTNNTPDIYAEAVAPDHPIFRGVPLMTATSASRGVAAGIVPVVDPAIGSGITSFLGTMDLGNGRLIARAAGTGWTWITEWDAGVEFYPGAGQSAGGKRLLFCAGTQEVGNTLQGEFNLRPEGRQMLHNAITYLIGGAKIIVVTDGRDTDADGLRDDLDLEAFLVSEGHLVDVRPNYWRELDPGKIAELRAADLIIVSRTADSQYYDDGDEPSQWNSLPVPLLQMSAYFTRNVRWEWVNSDLTTNNTDLVSLEMVDPNHPIFRNVPQTVVDAGNRRNPFHVVHMIDLGVGSGITSFSGIARMGNGRLLAKPLGFEMGWIAEWDAGVEFYTGAGQYAGARRLLLCAGTQEIQVTDPITHKLVTTRVGELNLTPQGLRVFRNAIAYLLPHGPQPQLPRQRRP
jgi:hypothetical protein